MKPAPLQRAKTNLKGGRGDGHADKPISKTTKGQTGARESNGTGERAKTDPSCCYFLPLLPADGQKTRETTREGGRDASRVVIRRERARGSQQLHSPKSIRPFAKLHEMDAEL